MAVDLDPRHSHSPLLFPLNAAAFCNLTVEGAIAKRRENDIEQPEVPLSPRSPSTGLLMAPISVAIIMRCSSSNGGELSTCTRLRNISEYIKAVVGLQCDIWDVCNDKDSSDTIGRLCHASFRSTISVIVLEREKDVTNFLSCADEITGETVLVAAPELLRTTAIVRGNPAKLSRFMLILTGAKEGVSDLSPYDGIAPAVLDSVASKVGATIAHGRLA